MTTTEVLVARRADRSGTDRERLARARRELIRFGILATAGQPGDPDDVAAWLGAAVRSVFPDADGACVFWTEPEEARCITPDGSLVEPLLVHVRGRRVAEAAAEAFRRAGLTVAPGPGADVVLVASGPVREPAARRQPADPASISGADHPHRHSPWDEAAVEPARRRARVVGIELSGPYAPWNAGPAEVRRRLTSSPVRFESLDRTGGGRFTLRLVCRDAEAYLSDAGIAEVLALLADRFSWHAMRKLGSADIHPHTSPRQEVAR